LSDSILNSKWPGIGPPEERMDIRCVSAAGASLGEGPLWDPVNGVIWWVDIKSPALHAHHVVTGVNRTQTLPSPLTALGLAPDGGLIGIGDAGLQRLSVAADLQVSSAEVIAAIALAPGLRFNDGKVDAAGRFWAGTMEDAERTARGSLYRIDRQRRVSVVRRDIGVPNGPCFFADGTMLSTDSAPRCITALTLDEDGNPIAEQEFARFTPSQGSPDGMTVDAEDHVWIAFWDGWCLRRLSRTGQIIAEIALPVQRPTCPVFGGDALDQLFITTATTGLSAEQLRGQPLAGGLLRLAPGMAGRASHLFAG
jgi:D-xylonolactonase